MAHIYRRKGKDYVTASSKTRHGFWLAEGFVDVLDSANPALAEAALGALARSRQGIPGPKDWSGQINHVVEAAGLKRFGVFAKGTALVSLKQTARQLRIVPHRNRGSRDGYVGLVEEAIELSAHSPDLARAIETAFARCT